MLLYSIREKAKGWIAWLIVILISIPFALWGVGSYITPDPNPAVAKVDGTKVGSFEFQSALQQQSQNNNAAVDDEILRNQVLQRLINNRALINHLNSQNYKISQSNIDRQIISDKNFIDPESGQFSPQVFSQALTRMGMTYEHYLSLLKEDTMLNQYLKGIQQASFVTDYEIEMILKLIKQKRDIEYVLINSDKYKDMVEISEQQIEEYYQQNQQNYEVAEQIKLAYIDVSRKAIAETIEVEDEQIEKYYQEHKVKYTQAEQRQASHILLTFKADDEKEKSAAKKEIDDIYAKLAAGEDFSELAKAHSKDPGSAAGGGDLGFFKKGDMVAEFEQVTFSLKPGELSEPFESPFGYHIVKVTSIKEEQLKPLAEVKNEIIKSLQYDLAEREFVQQTEQIQAIAYEQPDSLEPAAHAIEQQIKFSDFFSRDNAKDIFANDKLLNAAFSDQVLESGNNSDLIELTSDHVVVIRLVERKPAQIKPLQEVKESIVKTLSRKQQNTLAFELAESIADSLNSSADIQVLLDKENLQRIKKEAVERNNMDVPRQIVSEAFKMPVTNVKSKAKAIRMSNQSAVILVTRVEEGNIEDAAMKESIAQLLNQSQYSMLTNMAISQIRNNSKIEIYKERLKVEP